MSDNFFRSAQHIFVYFTLPVLATPGDIAFQTSDNTFYTCSASNTWVAIGSGGGGGTTLVTKTLTTQFDKTNNDSPSIVAGLTTNTLSVGTWKVTALLRLTVDSTGGGDISINSTGTVSVGVYDCVFTDMSTGLPFKGLRSVSTALSEVTWSVNTSVLVLVEATLTFTVAGAVRVFFCQETATPATTSSVLVGSSIVAIPFL